MTRKKKLGYYLLMFLALTVFLEMGAVVILKWQGTGLGPTSQRHLFSTYRGHKLNPDYVHREDTGGKTIHSTDGFREANSIIKKKPDDTIRVIMFGGSTMYGLGVYGNLYQYQPALSSDETIDYFLEKLVNEKLREKLDGKTVEIINAGIVGYQTFQHLIHYNERLHEYSPDFLIFLDGHNDYYIANKAHNHWMNYAYISTFLAHPVNERGALFTLYTIARYFGKHSYFFSLVERYIARTRLEKVREIPKMVIEGEIDVESETFEKDYYAVARRTYLRVYEQFKALSNYDGFEMIVVLQPEIIFEAEENLGVSDKNTRKVTINSHGFDRVGKMKKIRGSLKAIFSRHAIDFTDLGEIGSESVLDKKLYGDHVHLTLNGSQRVAELLSDLIERRFMKYGWAYVGRSD